MGGVAAAAPHSGKRQEAHRVINAALKALGFLGGGSTRERILFYGCRERRSRRNLFGWHKERILLDDPANDRVSTHDVDHRHHQTLRGRKNALVEPALRSAASRSRAPCEIERTLARLACPPDFSAMLSTIPFDA